MNVWKPFLAILIAVATAGGCVSILNVDNEDAQCTCGMPGAGQ